YPRLDDFAFERPIVARRETMPVHAGKVEESPSSVRFVEIVIDIITDSGPSWRKFNSGRRQHMLRNLFRRAAVADLDRLTVIFDAKGIEEWTDGRGLDVEGYQLERDGRTGQWNLVHFEGGTNRDTAGKIIATIPRLEDAVVILRGVVKQDLKPHYSGIVNRLWGREYCKSDDSAYGKYASTSAVERALKQQPR